MSKKFALIVSRLFDPVIISPLIIWLIILSTTTIHSKLIILALNIILVYFLPLLFLLLSLKLKFISDWDITKRKERYAFFSFIFVCIVFCLLLLNILKEINLLNFYLKLLLPLLIFFIITFFWKVSGHSLVNTIFVLLLYFYTHNSYIIYMGLFLLFLVGSSRIVLKKHTLLQVVAGSLLALLIL